MSLHTKIKSIIKPAIIIPAVLLFLTASSAFFLASSNSHADTTSAQASVTVPDTCYMSSSSTTHTGTATGGSYKENFGGESTVTVICNDRNGYSVYAIGCSGSDATNCSDTNKTKLIGASTNLTIPTGLSTDGSTSNWAMKLTPGTGSFAPTILNGYNNYSLVPAIATKVATLTSDINVSNLSQFKTSYAVAIASSQAADTYVGRVKYTVVHPNYVTPSGDLESYPITLGFGANTSSIIIDGTTYTSSSASPNLEYGTHTISGTYPSGYEFNSWSSTGSITIADSTSASTTISVTGAGTLMLTGKSGKLYMQDMTLAQCQKNVSNNIGEEIVAYDKRDESDYKIKYVNGQCWMTQNLRFVWSSSTTLTQALTNIGANKTITVGTLTSGDSYTEARVQYNNNTNSGAWYNFCAASAGDAAGCSDSATYSSDYDICPTGWRLPSSSELSNFTSFTSAISFYAYGYYNSGGSHYGNCNARCKGGYWSATPYDSTHQYFLWNDDGGKSIGKNFLKNYGFNIKCVKK